VDERVDARGRAAAHAEDELEERRVVDESLSDKPRTGHHHAGVEALDLRLDAALAHLARSALDELRRVLKDAVAEVHRPAVQGAELRPRRQRAEALVLAHADAAARREVEDDVGRLLADPVADLSVDRRVLGDLAVVRPRVDVQGRCAGVGGLDAVADDVAERPRMVGVVRREAADDGAGDEGRGVGGDHGATLVAPSLLKPADQLRPCLDALGDDLEPAHGGQLDDEPHEGGVLLVVRDGWSTATDLTSATWARASWRNTDWVK
jgi:hypothetical protein